MIRRLDSSQSRILLLVVVMAVAALGLDLWQQGARRHGRTAWPDSIVCSLSRPLQTSLIVSADFLEQEWKATVHARDVIGENAQLWDRVAALQDALLALQEASAASQRVAALQSAYGEAGPGTRIAHVIGIGQGGWSHYYTLDLGRDDGVEPRDVAVTAQGVVGQVYAVAARSSRLMPLTEPASAISVRLQRARDTGILEGIGGWKCEVRYLPPEADVKIGDQLITSGLGGVFPAGLRVGTVVSVIPDENVPGKIARVEPAADIAKLEEVLLLSGGGQGDATAPQR